MHVWLINIPDRTRVFLLELKALVLLEFIPYEWLSGGDLVTSIPYAEKTGIERFGSNNIINGFGSMFIIALVLSGIILLLLALKLL